MDFQGVVVECEEGVIFKIRSPSLTRYPKSYFDGFGDTTVDAEATSLPDASWKSLLTTAPCPYE